MTGTDWRNPDGTVRYKEYLDSADWRRFRESYWRRNPAETCARCGMDNRRHREKFSTRLHLRHLTYLHLGQEMDSDFAVLCKRCDEELTEQPDWFRYSLDVPGSGTDWMEQALVRLAWRRLIIGKSFSEEDPRLWKELKRLANLEEYVRYCMENPPVEMPHDVH